MQRLVLQRLWQAVARGNGGAIQSSGLQRSAEGLQALCGAVAVENKRSFSDAAADVAVERLGRLRGSSHELVQETNYANSLEEYNELSLSYMRQKRGYLVRDVYQDMLMDGVKPTRDTFNLMLRSCMRSNMLQDTLYLFREMKAMGIQPDVGHYNHLIAVAGRCGRAELAFSLVEEMQQQGMQPRYRTYLGLLNAAASAGQVNEANAIVAQMIVQGMPITKGCFASLIRATSAKSVYRQYQAEDKVLDLLDQSRTATAALGKEGLTVSASASAEDEEDAQDERANALREDYFHHNSTSMVVYHAALAGFLEMSRVKHVPRVLEMMEEDGLNPDSLTLMILCKIELYQGNVEGAVKYYNLLRQGRDFIPPLDVYLNLIESATRRYSQQAHEFAVQLLNDLEAGGLFLNTKMASHILHESARMKGFTYSLPDRVWDLCERHKIRPNSFALLSYLRGLVSRGDKGYEERIAEIRNRLGNPSSGRLGGWIPVQPSPVNSRAKWTPGKGLRRAEKFAEKEAEKEAEREGQLAAAAV